MRVEKKIGILCYLLVETCSELSVILISAMNYRVCSFFFFFLPTFTKLFQSYLR